MSDTLPYLTTKYTQKGRFLFDGCKLLWHRDKLQDYLDGKHISPIHIDMGIHKSCNIRCIYCYGIKQKPAPDYIPEDRLLKLADDAKECGIRSLAIIGDGEPTMNKGLYPFVQRGKKNNIDLSVATNGLLLDEDKIKILTESLVWVRFNISGVDKYDFIHGTKDSFSRFENIIQLAVKYGKQNKCTIGLQMVLIPQCFSEVIPLAIKAKRWGVDYLVIKQFSDPEEDIPVSFDMSEYDRVTEALNIVEGMSDENTSIIAKWSAIKDSRCITKEHIWNFDRCIDLPFIFQISGNGKCYPCGYLFGNDGYCYGSVIDQDIKTILSSARYREVIKRISETELINLCRGQCRHCETNKFIDRLTKLYTGNLEEALIKMCGSKEQYETLINNPPTHINFV